MLVRHTGKFVPPGGAFAGRSQFHFMEIPLFLKLRLGLANVSVNAFAGPDLTWLSDVTGRFSADREASPNDFNTFPLNSLRKVLGKNRELFGR
jgi:hypothetical protein